MQQIQQMQEMYGDEDDEGQYQEEEMEGYGEEDQMMEEEHEM